MLKLRRVEVIGCTSPWFFSSVAGPFRGDFEAENGPLWQIWQNGLAMQGCVREVVGDCFI